MPGTGLATDDTAVYFLDIVGDMQANYPGEIKAVPKTGGATTTLASGFFAPSNLIADQTHAYFLVANTQDQQGQPLKYPIVSVPLQGGTLTTVVDSDSTGDIPYVGPAVDATNLYFYLSDSLQVVPKAGGTATYAATNFEFIATNLAIDAAGLYWGAETLAHGYAIHRLCSK
jgi:hypothetical protein